MARREFSILWIPIFFCFATGYLYILTLAAPSITSELSSALKFPSNLQELNILATNLKIYYISHQLYVIILFSSAYIYKQTFAIPGSVFMNLLAGTLFGFDVGFPLVCFLTATGVSCCYMLSKYFGKHYVMTYFPQTLEMFQSQVQNNLHRLFFFLLCIRIAPFSPNWAINILSPMIGVPLHYFYLTALIGLMPYNFVCIQAGVMLSEIVSLDDLLTFGTSWKLIILAAAFGLPGLLIKSNNRRTNL